MTLPVGKRRYHAFISHAHVDKSITDDLYNWLSEMAKIPIWYDSVNLQAGTRIASNLSQAIASSRGVMIAISKTSVTRGWVQEEYDMAIGHKAENPDFRIIPIQIDDTPPPGFLASYKSVSLLDGHLTLAAAEGILTGLYGETSNATESVTRDVYISRGWHLAESAVADEVCRIFDPEDSSSSATPRTSRTGTATELLR